MLHCPRAGWSNPRPGLLLCGAPPPPPPPPSTHTPATWLPPCSSLLPLLSACFPALLNRENVPTCQAPCVQALRAQSASARRRLLAEWELGRLWLRKKHPHLSAQAARVAVEPENTLNRVRFAARVRRTGRSGCGGRRSKESRPSSRRTSAPCGAFRSRRTVRNAYSCCGGGGCCGCCCCGCCCCASPPPLPPVGSPPAPPALRLLRLLFLLRTDPSYAAAAAPTPRALVPPVLAAQASSC